MAHATTSQAYSITLASGKEVIARVARRFMPRLKTESEIATMQYLRERTTIPVPDVYHYDANPYNRLGGEYIIMSKVRTGFSERRAYVHKHRRREESHYRQSSTRCLTRRL